MIADDMWRSSFFVEFGDNIKLSAFSRPLWPITDSFG